MLVEIELKVRSRAGYAGESQGVSLETGVLMLYAESVYTIDSSGGVARQQLPEDIMSLALPRVGISRHQGGGDDNGVIDLLPEVLVGQMLIHILGIGLGSGPGTKWSLQEACSVEHFRPKA
ncbi:hypothetical protein B9Z19DRAFT_1130358 [Tuber borchii]|uniref:Uncharacterized protein n=1 Tax=Tuber borchii TaxID=42251 RepID=A0A2T6ZKN9_TUBBO|nr:hypothetical protein B9Z19DRAFT_1130358 [Tuber borchii]